jgi:hypothetical protein
VTEKSILLWIHRELVPFQLEAMDEIAKTRPGHIYTTDLLSAMTMREVGHKIAEYVGERKMKARDIHPIMRGDYSQRPGEKEKSYHGYGYMQIDIGSFPAFVKSGDWKDPKKTYIKAIQVLDDKRTYLKDKFPHLEGDVLLKAAVAAYNCGEGRVSQVLRGIATTKTGKKTNDVDRYTHGGDYSKEVFRFREIYNSLPETQ